MAIVNFSSKEIVFESFTYPERQSLSKVYYDTNTVLVVGTSIYSDKTLTNKLDSGRWYGLKNYNGRNWALKVNELGKISEISESKSNNIGFLPMFPFSNITKAKFELTQAANAGANGVYLVIELSNVFKNIDEFNANAAASWTGYDELINYINGIYSTVNLRICADYDDTLFYDLTANPVVPKTNALFDLFTDMAQDEWGNPARIGRGSGHACLAKDSARAKMTGFYSMVLQRYSPILGNKLVGVSFANAAQQESGYNYENQFYDANGILSPLKTTMFDYHPACIYDFANNFCKALYGTPTHASEVHGKSYNNWSDILPPKTGKSSLLSTTDEEVYGLLKSPLGLDWYKYKYSKLKEFWLECKAILAAFAPQAKFIMEAGSFTDSLARLRTMFDIIDMATFVDVFKAQFSGVDWNGKPEISATIVDNNVGNKEIQVEVNENDVVTQGHITDKVLVKEAMFNTIKSGVANGATTIWIIANSESVYFQNSLALIQEFKEWNSQNPNYKTTDGATINIPISKFIQNYESAYSDCISAGINTGITNRPVIKLIKDI